MDARLINSSTDLVALVPGLRKHGQYHIGPCPFCGGDDRFTVKRAEAGDLWICRKCGDGRYHDAVAFRMRAEGKNFKEVTSDERRATSSEWSRGAGERGSRGAGGQGRRGEREGQSNRQSPNRQSPNRQSPNLQSPPDEEWQIPRVVGLAKAAEALLAGADELARQAWHYLRAHRGLEPDTIRAYTLGFNPDWWPLSDGTMFPPGLFIPGMVDGELWYAKVRLMEKTRLEFLKRGRELPKYMVLKGGRPAALFNGDRLAGATTAVVVEGEFDAMLLGQYLPQGWAAVTMGSAGVLPGPAFLPLFHYVDRVLLALDADAAGAAGLAAWKQLLGNAEVLPPLPGGAKDITDFWRAGGDIGQWLKQGGF